ncbi:TonB-dependent siderophore receptor [Candidatus Hamiltonella defensa]|nr:TonB-dependent siderophore receptor [Candidatus Hamiltonella defensa]MBK4360876.1 TonB-dependent siderophore receptor [Candidatus Hamiltonella defensa]
MLKKFLALFSGFYKSTPLIFLMTVDALAQSSLGSETVSRKIINQEKEERIIVQEYSFDETKGLISGGKKARHANIGLLGNKDLMDTPFSVSSYTSKYMEESQAITLSDAITQDPSVRSTSQEGGLLDSFSLRGFPGNEGNLGEVAFNGVYGIAPNYQLFPEYIERVEVFKGPATFLYGMSPNHSVGGVINVISKRAGAKHRTQLTTGYGSDNRFSGHIDTSRLIPLKDHEMLGIRFNGHYRAGDTPWHHQNKKEGAAALALDYFSERFRSALDLLIQNQKVNAPVRPFMMKEGIPVPNAPGSGTNISQPWGWWHSSDQSVLLHSEYDLVDDITVFFNIGGAQTKVERLSDQIHLITSEAGDVKSTIKSFRFNIERYSLDAGLRSAFTTGYVDHQIALQTSLYHDRIAMSSLTGPEISSNIYSPKWVTNPNLPAPGEVAKSSASQLSGLALADMLSIFDDRFQISAGLRYQKIQSDNFGKNHGRYDKSAFTPMLGLLVKPWEPVSLYANYIEGLSKGDIVPNDAKNAGEILPPYKSRQYEVGIKIDAGKTISTLSLFQITKPSAQPIGNKKDNSYYSADNEQRNRGVELNVSAEPWKGIRLMTGVSLIDARLTKISNSAKHKQALEGKRPVGVSAIQANAGIEYDVSRIQGLMLFSHVMHSGKQYVDLLNTQSIPAWTSVDIGGQYQTQFFKKNAKLHLKIKNLFDRNDWSGVASYRTFSQGSPRTLLLSAMLEF